MENYSTAWPHWAPQSLCVDSGKPEIGSGPPKAGRRLARRANRRRGKFRFTGLNRRPAEMKISVRRLIKMAAVPRQNGPADARHSAAARYLRRKRRYFSIWTRESAAPYWQIHQLPRGTIRRPPLSRTETGTMLARTEFREAFHTMEPATASSSAARLAPEIADARRFAGLAGRSRQSGGAGFWTGRGVAHCRARAPARGRHQRRRTANRRRQFVQRINAEETESELGKLAGF